MGPGTLPSKHLPPDQDQLQHMLMVLRLQVLNSWGKKSKSFTFENGEAKTQIDFTIMRSARRIKWRETLKFSSITLYLSGDLVLCIIPWPAASLCCSIKPQQAKLLNQRS